MAITVPVPNTALSVSGFGKPVADQLNSLAVTAWQTLTLASGWSVPAGSGRSPNRCRKRGDMVDLLVTATGGTSGTVVTTVPAGHFPLYTIDWVGRDQSVWNINNAGQVIIYGSTSPVSTAYLVCSYPTT